MKKGITAIFCATFFVVGITTAQADGVRENAKLKMRYLSNRQSVISQNIANVNTPGYKARELEPMGQSKKSNSGQITLQTTSPMHISVAGNNSSFKTIKDKDTYEIKPDGNTVSVEEQMVKMSANSLEYNETVGILKKLNNITLLAVGDK